MIEPLATTASSAAVGAAVSAILCALAARYLVPKWLKDREEFETKITAQLEEISRARIASMAECSAENRRLQERMDGADTAIKFDMIARETAMREVWHAEADQFNRQLGKVNGKTAQNERAVERIHERLDEMERQAETRHKEQTETYHSLDKTVDRLAGTIDNLGKTVDKLNKSMQ